MTTPWGCCGRFWRGVVISHAPMRCQNRLLVRLVVAAHPAARARTAAAGHLKEAAGQPACRAGRHLVCGVSGSICA
jgi:hypothetical protein